MELSDVDWSCLPQLLLRCMPCLRLDAGACGKHTSGHYSRYLSSEELKQTNKQTELAGNCSQASSENISMLCGLSQGLVPGPFSFDIVC